MTHFFVYGWLTWVGITATNYKKILVSRASIYLVVLLVSIFVVVEEFSQLFMTTRTFDWGDLLADLIGIIVATVLANIIEQKDTEASLK